MKMISVANPECLGFFLSKGDFSGIIYLEEINVFESPYYLSLRGGQEADPSIILRVNFAIPYLMRESLTEWLYITREGRNKRGA